MKLALHTSFTMLLIILNMYGSAEDAHEKNQIITQARKAIKEDDQPTFLRILEEHPDILFHSYMNQSTPSGSDGSLLSQCIELDGYYDRTDYICELLKCGAPLQPYALNHHIRQAFDSICHGFTEETVLLRISNVERFYQTVASAPLPEDLAFNDYTLGDITTPQKFLQAYVLKFLRLNIWYCNYCERPWRIHQKPNPDYQKRLAAAVQLTQNF